MILQILDRQFNTLATVDNSLAGAIHFFNDEFHRYMADAVSTFNFSVLRNQPDIEHLVEGNYIQFTYNSRDYLMTIRRIEEDEWQLDIETEDLSLDLINETTGEYAASKAMKITEYLKIFLGNDTDVVLGLNEVYSYTRTLEWTGESTVLERIKSLANYFDAEIEFVTELNDDRSLKQLTLNIYHKYDDTHQGVGTDRSDIELRFGENVSTVKRTTDIRELYTAIKPVGSEGVNIKTIEETIKDDNGNVLYYTPKGSEYIYAPLANDRFGRQKAADGAGYILMVYSYDTESVATLYGNALAQLKKYSEPAVTYEVEGFYDLDIGDVVSIADNKYTPTLLLEARVSEMVISFTQPESNKTIFSNYRVFESQVDSDLLKLMDDLKSDVDYAMQVAKTPIFKISTLGSTVFKNGEGEVELSAAVERANTDVTSEYSVFNWVKEFKLGGIDEEWTAAHKNFGKSITITPADFDDTAVFYYEAEGLDGTLHTGGSTSLVKVYDGEDGQTPVKGVDYFDGVNGTNGTSAYLHVRYSQNADGNPMTPDPTDAKYLGLQASQNPNASTVPADYDWSLVKGPQGIPGEAVDGKTSYLHIKYSNDGGKTFTGNTGEDTGAYLGQYVDFEPADSTDVTKYAWSKIKGEDGEQGEQGNDGVGIASTAVTYQASSSGTTEPTGNWSTTVPEVSAGNYLWTRTIINYTDSTSSTSYSVSKMGADGSEGTSVISVVEEYYISTSPDSQAGGSWSTTVPNNADPNKYIWRRMKTTLSDGTVTYTNPALIQGMTGIYPYIGPNQPANPKEGQQWWKSDSSGNVTNFYVYKNGSWQGQTIQQSILNIVALNAVTITGSTITGTNINGSVFTNTFTIDLGVSDTGTGTTVIRDGALKMDMAVKDSAGTASYTQGQELSMQNGLYMWQKLEGQSATDQSYARLTPAGLDLQSIAGGAVRNTTLSIDSIYSLVRPASRSIKPADDSNRKSVSLSYSRVGNIVSVGINFELLSDTGWVALAPVAPSGYRPASAYQATGMACSLSYRGYTCAVYYNSSGFRLIPTTGQGKGEFQLGLTWRTNDPFPYGDS